MHAEQTEMEQLLALTARSVEATERMAAAWIDTTRALVEISGYLKIVAENVPVKPYFEGSKLIVPEKIAPANGP